MSETMLKYQCPKCGGTLEFNPTKQMLVCEFCESEFHEDIFKPKTEPTAQAPGAADAQGQEPNMDDSQYEQNDTRVDWKVEGYVKKQEVMGDQPGFNCTSCGAVVVSDGNTVATECMYCGNPVVIAGNVSGMVKPDMVIPFRIEKEKAEQLLKDFYKGKKLLPDAFTSGNRVKKITGMYVPFWLFSCNGNGNAKYTAKKVRSWSSGGYRYVETKIYSAYRSGTMAFEKIPVDASTKMEDDYMDGLEPYDYRDFKDFNTMYMAGYFSDKFDVDVSTSSVRADARVRESVVNALKETVKGYSSVTCDTASVNMVGEDIHYALLPVWMLNTKYEGKMYQFAINGQTGKVSGNLPVDKGKLLKYRLLITLAGLIPFGAIAYWLFS